MQRVRKNQEGLTLIELLVVVGIVGVLSAMAIVNFLIALDKSKQKKSMADMRSIAIAWEARATDRGAYSAAGQSPAFVWPSEDVTFTELKAILTPTYIRPMARVDGWGFPFEFGLDLAIGNDQGATIYAIRSPGRDGMFESSYPTSQTNRFECDIVYTNGSFAVAPSVK